MKFRDHKYTYTHPHMSARHEWTLRGPVGGISFSVSILDDPGEYPDPVCGLEFHSAVQPSDEKPRAADHTNCHITGGICWHEGTSLYAAETIWPTVKEALASGNHHYVFSVLEWEYEIHFEETTND